MVKALIYGKEGPLRLENLFFDDTLTSSVKNTYLSFERQARIVWSCPPGSGLRVSDFDMNGSSSHFCERFLVQASHLPMTISLFPIYR
jgi:hypothetical protein